MTEEQKRMLDSNGEMVFIDATHGTTQNGYVLTTMLVIDNETKKGTLFVQEI